MCRWLVYTWASVLTAQALYTPAHSLIDQSLHAQLGTETTNGDGFGLGWYDGEETPGVFRSIEPAWNDQNLRELAAHIRSPMFFAHVRAAIGSAVQQTNSHRSQFFSRDLHTLRELYPHREILQDISDDARLIVSEPVGDLPGAWNEMPESSWGVTGRGYAQLEPFAPKTSATAVAVPE